MRSAESTPQPSFNPHLSLLFFHFVIEISEEVADQVIKGARQFSSERHVRDARVRDAVRERDAARINEAVLTIVADYAERLLKALRKEAYSHESRNLRGSGGDRLGHQDFRLICRSVS